MQSLAKETSVSWRRVHLSGWVHICPVDTWT